MDGWMDGQMNEWTGGQISGINTPMGRYFIYCPVTCFFKNCGKNPEQIYSPEFFSIQYSVDSRLIVVSDSLEFLFLSGN